MDDRTELEDRLIAFSKTLLDPQEAIKSLMGDDDMVKAVNIIFG